MNQERESEAPKSDAAANSAGARPVRRWTGRPGPYAPRVMVLDERTEEFEALSRSLEAAGVRSIRVSTFEEGIRGLASGSIDVVVASTTIRDGGAVRIYEDVKACRPLAQVIFLTGPGRVIGDGSDQSNGAGHRVTDVIASLEAGATDFFVLPLRNIHCLQESIQSALKRVDRWRASLVGPLEEERTG